MIIVIDTNAIISAMIKEGLSRELILNKFFDFITPSFTISEITKYKQEICKKSGISYLDFEVLLERLFKHIRIINIVHYRDKLALARGLIEDIDDVPFLACALYFDCPVWSDDKHFKKQNVVKILTSKEMSELIDKDKYFSR